MPLFSSAPVVSVVRLSGIIGQLGPLRRGLSLRGVAGQLERAFQPKRLRAVALAVNSPGGSPVQAALIFRRVRQLARKKDVPVLVFIEEVAASGGYWLACAGDEIYADENSIVGSIGVISASFGFSEAIKRFGIERRVHTSGEHKAALDPFLPEDAHDVARLKAIQTEVHESFKTLVRSRRGRKLRAAEDQLFNGDFWTGKRAQEIGLIDGIGDMRAVIMDRFGQDVRIMPIGERVGWLRRRLGVRAEREAPEMLGASFAAGLIATLEERFLWSRFGL
jgi:signal peptide peptidase SppA